MSSLLRSSWRMCVDGFSRIQCTRHLTNLRPRQTYAAGAAAPTVNSNNKSQRIPDGVVPVFKRALRYGEKTALRDVQGDYTYRGLFLSSRQFANYLSNLMGGSRQERVAFLLPNNASYVIVQWACWMSGHIAVPLSVSNPGAVLDYYIKDSDVRVIVTTKEYSPLVEPLVANTNRRVAVFDEALRVLAMKADGRTANNRASVEPEAADSIEMSLENDYDNSDAMFIYTSGTTGKPKAVVLSHKNLQSQIQSLVDAWKWTERDNVLHTLPLNHIHGVVNVLLCSLYVGARCVILPKFETSNVWSQLLGINLQNTERVNMYMAVPTIYTRLIQEYDEIFSRNAKFKEYVRTVCSNKIRLMVSGSSPLPKPIFDRWEEITGHRLLERYGMTETGMVLSNPLEGQRIPGTVGRPLPGVRVRITKLDTTSMKDDEILIEGSAKQSRELVKSSNGPISGNLRVKGDSVFREYWNKGEETSKEFTDDGWFKTGDVVQYEDGIYSILGRSSVDIIKTGGYKVSALQVETAILGHPDIVDCAVVGLADDTWGQKVAAVVVVKEGSELILSQLRAFGKLSLPKYAVPTVLRVVDKIPKNSMGKVNKPELSKALFSTSSI